MHEPDFGTDLTLTRTDTDTDLCTDPFRRTVHFELPNQSDLANDSVAFCGDGDANDTNESPFVSTDVYHGSLQRNAADIAVLQHNAANTNVKIDAAIGHSYPSFISKMTLAGNIRTLQIAVNHLNLKTHMIVDEQMLASNQQSNAAHCNLADILFVCIPGLVNRDGNQRDGKIARNLATLVDLHLRSNKHVVIFGAPRNPAWKHAAYQELLKSSRLFHQVVNHCMLGATDQGMPIYRRERIAATITLPQRLCECDHSSHVMTKHIPETIKTAAIRELVSEFQKLFDNSRVSNDPVVRTSENASVPDSRFKSTFAMPVSTSNASEVKDTQKLTKFSKVKTKTKKNSASTIPVEEHYDDCGDNDTQLRQEVDHMSAETFVVFDIASDPEQNSSDSDESSNQESSAFVTDSCTYFTNLQSAMVAFDSYSGRRQYKHDVAQLFGGHGDVIRLGIRKGLRPGRNWDAMINIDLSLPEERKRLWSYFKKFRPRVVVASPPCTPFGRWSSYNRVRNYKAWHSSFKLASPLAILTAMICEFQVRHGRHFIVENPLGSKIFKLPAWVRVLRIPGIVASRVDQCAYGLADDDGNLVFKPTTFIASHAALLGHLRKTCDGSHQHAQLAGTLRGVPRCKAAQKWPPKLCLSIIEGIRDLIMITKAPVYAVKRKKDEVPQSIEPEVGSQSAPSHCPGCKVHARKDDARHNRHPAVCKFPDDQSVDWPCPACRRHAHNSSREHTKIKGNCQWATAPTRSTQSRTAQQRSIAQAPEEEVEATHPPVTAIGAWKEVSDVDFAAKLDFITNRDGWLTLDGEPVLVATQARALRTSEPRYNASKYPLRSTYGLFPDYQHEHGSWWQLEDKQSQLDTQRSRRYLGYAVPLLVHVFHAASSTESFTPKSLNQIDESAFVPMTPQAKAAAAAAPSTPEYLPNPAQRNEQAPETPQEQLVPLERSGQLAIPTEHGQEYLPPAQSASDVVIEPVDWSSWTMGKMLHYLRSAKQSQIVAGIRKLHLRLWHAGSKKLTAILGTAGLPKSVLDLVPSVVDSCQICRQWQRPTNRSVTSNRLAEQFNEVVQVDLLFVEDKIILHMIDEATRFTLLTLIPDRQSGTIVDAMTECWNRYFEAPKLILSDQEGGLCSDEASVWAERFNTTFRFKPKGTHAAIVERHHAIVRDLIHKILGQLRAEGIAVNWKSVIAEASFAKNVLTNIGGYSPFVAVFGRFPRLLTDLENAGISQINDELGPYRKATRLREIALESMIQQHSQTRLAIADKSQSRHAGQLIGLQNGDLCDIYRSPATKDLVGWRGPCEVINVSNLEQGYIDVKWQGRVMSARIADVRKHMPFIAFMASDHLAVVTLHHYLLTLSKCTQTFAWVHSPKGYILTQHARANMEVFHALLYIGKTIFNLSDCVGGRVGQGIMTIPGLYGITESVLIWYHPTTPELYHSLTVNPSSMLYLNHIFEGSGSAVEEEQSSHLSSRQGTINSWQNVVWFQLLNSASISTAKMKPSSDASMKPTPVTSNASMKSDSGERDASINTASSHRSVPQLSGIPEDDVVFDDDIIVDGLDVPVSSGDIPAGSRSRDSVVSNGSVPAGSRSRDSSVNNGSVPAGSRSRDSSVNNGSVPVGSRSRDSSSELRQAATVSQHSQRTPVLTNGSEASTIRTHVSAGSVGTRTISQPSGSQTSVANNSRSRSRSSHHSDSFRSNHAIGERTPTPVVSSSSNSRSRSGYGNPVNEQYSPTVTMQSDHSSLVSGNQSNAYDNENNAIGRSEPEASTETFESDDPELDSDGSATLPDPSIDRSDLYLDTYMWYEISNLTHQPSTKAYWDRNAVVAAIVQSQVESANQHGCYCVSCPDTETTTEYNDGVEIEMPAYLARWLQEPVLLDSQSCLVFQVSKSDDGQTTVKRVIERDFDILTPTEVKQHWSLVTAAIKKELQSFVDLSVFKPVPTHEVSNIMSSRWILKWKLVDGQRVVKARLTVRGFEDLSATTLETYANTATRWGQRLVTSCAAQLGWKLFCWDISTAFLQGVSFQELSQITGEPLRKVAMRIPKDSAEFFQHFPELNVNFDTHVLLMLKPVYGLKDAPRAWRIRLDMALKELGGKALHSDSALYVWHNARGNLQLILSTHVDDKKGAGENDFATKIKTALEKMFGKIKEQVGSFEHCGIMHEQTQDGIVMHQHHYVKQLNLLDMTGVDHDRLELACSETQHSAYLSLLGGMSWLVQTRMDVSVFVCALQRNAKNPKLEHYVKLNRLTKWVKHKKCQLFYKTLVGPLKVLAISDSAFKKEDCTGLAMRGALICIAEKHESTPGGSLHVIDFYSRKQRRITRSTFAAELHGLADAIEFSKLVAFAVHECLTPSVTPRELVVAEETGKLKLSIEAVIDAMSVFDALVAPETRMPSESSLIMILLQIKELLRTHTLKRLWWVDTVDMVADGLNKGSVNRQALLLLGQTGVWNLTKAGEFHSEPVQVTVKALAPSGSNSD